MTDSRSTQYAAVSRHFVRRCVAGGLFVAALATAGTGLLVFPPSSAAPQRGDDSSSFNAIAAPGADAGPVDSGVLGEPYYFGSSNVNVQHLPHTAPKVNPAHH